MDLKFLQLGAREYEVRSYFKEQTWKSFLKRFPEIKEISFIGKYGTWKKSVRDAVEHNRIEIYLSPEAAIREKTSDKEWSSLLIEMYQFLQMAQVKPIPLEVKVETNYLDDYSGWVMRSGLSVPRHFWHHGGIQGFSSRVRINEDTERMLYEKSS